MDSGRENYGLRSVGIYYYRKRFGSNSGDNLSEQLVIGNSSANDKGANFTNNKI